MIWASKLRTLIGPAGIGLAMVAAVLFLGACGDDVLRLPDGDFNEAELRQRFETLLSEAPLRVSFCENYVGRSDEGVANSAREVFETPNPIGYVRMIENVKPGDFLRMGVILRDICERLATENG